MSEKLIADLLSLSIATLPYEQQVILSLNYVEDLSLAEIAFVLNTPPAIVYKKYLEAIANLSILYSPV